MIRLIFCALQIFKQPPGVIEIRIQMPKKQFEFLGSFTGTRKEQDMALFLKKMFQHPKEISISREDDRTIVFRQ